MIKTKFILTSAVFITILCAFVFTSCKNGSGDPAGSKESKNRDGAYPDFIAACKAVTPLVVHIKTIYRNTERSTDHVDSITGSSEGSGFAMGSGSGIVISPDGYIATNNHVIEDAIKIEVIFPDRREYAAEVRGIDPNTDLALLKIKAENLPVIRFGNSDDIEVGAWVLAIGYPYSLNTTVTAGIISAKGRSLGIINTSEGARNPRSAAIESFIQTDAAINAGNSGGALVNTSGELIGINTAISSRTGSFSGYAFSIPVNLAKKILNDLKEYGEVQRGILGVGFFSPVDENRYLKEQGINPGTVKGVFVTDIQGGSAADEAGLKEADIIQSIDGIPIYSSGELSEMIARHRPADTIQLSYQREGKEYAVTARLKGEVTTAMDETAPLKKTLQKLGASFAPLSPEQERRLNLRSGVMITEIYKGGFFEQLGIRAGTVISFVNGKEVKTPADIEDALTPAPHSRAQIIAIGPDGVTLAFNFSLGT